MPSELLFLCSELSHNFPLISPLVNKWSLASIFLLTFNGQLLGLCRRSCSPRIVPFIASSSDFHSSNQSVNRHKLKYLNEAKKLAYWAHALLKRGVLALFAWCSVKARVCAKCVDCHPLLGMFWLISSRWDPPETKRNMQSSLHLVGREMVVLYMGIRVMWMRGALKWRNMRSLAPGSMSWSGSGMGKWGAAIPSFLLNFN